MVWFGSLDVTAKTAFLFVPKSTSRSRRNFVCTQSDVLVSDERRILMAWQLCQYEVDEVLENHSYISVFGDFEILGYA